MLTVEKTILLSRTRFFGGLSGQVLAEVAAQTQEVEAAAGRVLFAKGDWGESLYVIVSGTVLILDPTPGDPPPGNAAGAPGEPRTLAVLDEGDVFGELAALDPETRSATAQTATDALLLRLDHEALLDVIADHQELARAVIRFLCRRYRDSIDVIKDGAD